MINDFNFMIPQEILFGVTGIKKIGGLMKRENLKRVLLISDRSLENLGTVERVKNVLAEAKVECESYLEVEPNPSCETCEEAAELYKAFGADSILALGGGSPMDVAKATGVLVTFGGKIPEYEGSGTVPGPLKPVVIAVPTTAGTGSETTPFAVITDVSRHYKLTIYSYDLIPKYALLDPEMIMSLPPDIAASTGMDALVHALESYVSQSASPFSDMMAEKAMELIGRYIRLFVANRANIEAASAMMIASNFAGLAFGWARLGNIHAMAHPLSGHFNIPHGVANAILLPFIVEYNALADMGRYERIYRIIRQDHHEYVSFSPQMLIDELRVLAHSLGIPTNLTEVGVTPDLIAAMAADAMKSGNILANPRRSTQKDIEKLYESAM